MRSRAMTVTFPLTILLMAAITLLLDPSVVSAQSSSLLREEVSKSLSEGLNIFKAFMEFIKVALIVGGAFLAIYAGIGVWFFGFKADKARKDLNRISDSLREQQREIEKIQKVVADAQVSLKLDQEKLTEELREQRSAVRVCELDLWC